MSQFLDTIFFHKEIIFESQALGFLNSNFSVFRIYPVSKESISDNNYTRIVIKEKICTLV